MAIVLTDATFSDEDSPAHVRWMNGTLKGRLCTAGAVVVTKDTAINLDDGIASCNWMDDWNGARRMQIPVWMSGLVPELSHVSWPRQARYQ